MANLEVSSIPSSLLISFFETAKSRLDESEIENSTSSTNIRRLLLGIQNTCLEKVVEEYNEQQQQQQQQLDSEKHISTDIVRQVLPQLQLNAETEESVKKALTEMNEAARLAFCRLILYSECLRKFAQHNNSNHNTDAPPLQTSGTFLRDDILEFIGLCNTCVKLPNVLHHLSTGAPLFDDLTEEALPPRTIFPHKRLEYIQRLIMQGVGYDPDFGSSEIKRIFFTRSGQTNLEGNDPQLATLFGTLIANMNAAITNATVQATQNNLFSDHDIGGVTRVLSVNYSEQVIPGDDDDDDHGDHPTHGTNTAVAAATSSSSAAATAAPGDAPWTQSMEQQADAKQRQQLLMAREAARAQQEMLGELLTMREEEREARLEQGRRASQELNDQLAQLAPGPERVALLQSIDLKTQRLIVMEKMWSSMLEQNGGKPPRMV